MLGVGAEVPNEIVSDDEGGEVRLAELKGPYILYFYPADDTPGCTKEACSFRDNFAEFKQAGVDVYGVSPDTVESHAKFRAKYHLPFRLLADPDHKLAEEFGAWGEKSFRGRTSMGVLRTTFVVGRDGRVQHVYPKVKPEEHAGEILRDLAADQPAPGEGSGPVA